MKMSQLKMAIREVVREEIRSGLTEIIGEMKQPQNEVVKKTQPTKPREKQNFTNNPVLNEVLNETDASDWETMGGEKFTTERMNDLVGGNYKDLMNGSQEPGVVVDGQQPDFLKKDYRSLMKAIDDKKDVKNG